jgi:hypothetical protein
MNHGAGLEAEETSSLILCGVIVMKTKAQSCELCKGSGELRSTIVGRGVDVRGCPRCEGSGRSPALLPPAGRGMTPAAVALAVALFGFAAALLATVTVVVRQLGNG